ncbi:MAG: uncharacterized protein JWO95_3095 [Verrucomicrobiales bacterium]|nr:uncharacterized protein [Verrucomicrobiales bacterium]
MSTVYFSHISRSEFGNLLSDEGLAQLPIRSSAVAALYPGRNELLAIWMNHPTEKPLLPAALVCEDGTENDWSAWISTYAPRLRPFSAYCRLLPRTFFVRYAEQSSKSNLGEILWPVAGLILGELLVSSRLPDKALDNVSGAACASTLSFAIFRAAAMYGGTVSWRELTERWLTVRMVTKQRERPLDHFDIGRICADVLTAFGTFEVEREPERRDSVVEACRDLMRSPQRTPTPFFSIPGFGETEDKMHGSREDRVIAFDRFATSVNQEPVELQSELLSFALGYLASRIAPGTMRHATVLERTMNRCPSSALWYGFCAGFGDTDRSSAMSNTRRGVDLPIGARRLARDLTRDGTILDPPTCDIAFRELLVLSRTADDPMEGITTTTHGTAIVELAPCVETTVNTSSRRQVDSGNAATQDRDALEKLGAQIERLAETYRSISRSQQSVTQPDFPAFGSSRRRRR